MNRFDVKSGKYEDEDYLAIILTNTDTKKEYSCNLIINLDDINSIVIGLKAALNTITSEYAQTLVDKDFLPTNISIKFYMTETEMMIRDCLKRESKLNSWERQFMQSLQDKDHHKITANQLDKLNVIWDRVT